MTLKKGLLALLVIVLGVFVFFKIESLGSPNNQFNQSTRFSLGKYGFFRAVLGLHNKGDARAEYLEGTGPLAIVWFEPATENVDNTVVQQFADLASKYTGRQTQVIFGGSYSEGSVNLSTVSGLGIRGGSVAPGSSMFYVVFVSDYTPRGSQELSTALGETAAVISLNANRQFVGNNQSYIDRYLLSDMLHQFGSELGLPEQGSDPSCIMNPTPGTGGQAFESSGFTDPQDFCSAEVDELNSIKASLQ